jgi:hypothetical protein
MPLLLVERMFEMNVDSMLQYMTELRLYRRRVSLQVALYFVALLAICGPIRAENLSAEKNDSSLKLEDKQPDSSDVKQKESSESDESHWYFGYGPANVHAKLNTSEARINREINDTLGSVVPGWSPPRTFRDWNDEWRIWDMHFIVGRDLSSKLDGFLDFGASAGLVKNKDNYLLPIPFRTNIRFSRVMWFVSCGLNYYPWGKPELESNKSDNPILRSLLSAKPYIEGTVGYVSEDQAASVKMTSGPCSLKIRKTYYPRASYVSPRIGLEIPVDDDDSIKIQAGYLFFDKYSDDCNNLSLYFFHQHRF